MRPIFSSLFAIRCSRFALRSLVRVRVRWSAARWLAVRWFGGLVVKTGIRAD